MSTRRIATTIKTALCFIALVVIAAACNTDQGMMHGSGSTGMANWNWFQILISFGIGIIIGYLLGMSVSKKKK
jgi:formate-dependent nitrite reductase membrane component NrfD